MLAPGFTAVLVRATSAVALAAMLCVGIVASVAAYTEDPPVFLYRIEGTGGGLLSEPHGVALDDDGNVYVVDTGNCRVQKFDADGDYILMVS